MMVLDTNVVSEGMKPAPEPAVKAWLRNLDPGDLAVTVTMAEILYGIALLPRGRRRSDLEVRFRSFLARVLDGRILVFDSHAAEHYAVIASLRRAAGRPMSIADTMVAAIVAANGATIATRNVSDFTDFGVAVFDPWSS